MKNILNNVYLIFILRLSIGLFFIYASVGKINHPAEFAQAIRSYEIIPDSLSALPAIFLPWLELVCGILLVVGIFVNSSVKISMGLLIFFTINVLIALFRGLDIDCGCGASISGIEKVSWGKIFENTFLILLTVLISKQQSYIFTIEKKLTS